MERISLTRTDDPEEKTRGMRITIRMRTRPLRLAGLGAGILASGVLSWALLDGSLGEEGAGGTMLGAVSVFSVAALPALAMAVMTWRLLWSAAGRETIHVRRHGICVRQWLGPLSIGRTYSAAPGNKQGGQGRPERKPFWEMLCIESGRGSVVLMHENRMVRVARDLDKAEGVYLVTAVRILMQSRPAPSQDS